MNREREWQEDEFDIRELIGLVQRYRKSIIITTLLVFLIALIKVYITPPLYESQSVLKLSPALNSVLKDNVYPGNFGDFIQDELEIFHNPEIARKVQEKLPLSIRYFSDNGFKKTELYPYAPFRVRIASLDPQLYGMEFTLTPEKGDRFLLSVRRSVYARLKDRLLSPSAESSRRFDSYTALHRFGEWIRTPWFRLKIDRVRPLTAKTYLFTPLSPGQVNAEILRGISAQRTSRLGTAVRIRFRDTVPERSRDILRELVQAYIDYKVEAKKKSAQQRLNYIQAQLHRIDLELKRSAEELGTYKSQTSLLNPETTANMNLTKLVQYKSKLYENDMQITLLKQFVDRLKSASGQEGINTDLSLFNIGFNNPVAPLVQALQQSRARYAQLKTYYTPDHPALRALQKKITSLKRSLDNTIRTTLTTLQERRKTLQAQIRDEMQSIRKLPLEERRLNYLTQTYMVNKKIYSFLLEKQAEISIEKSSIIPDVEVMVPATYNPLPVKPRPLMTLTVGLILGIVLGLMQAFVRHLLDNRIHSTDDLLHITSLPLYGVLPKITDKKSALYYQESLRSLWINLSFFKTSGTTKVITITSTLPEEGKTMTLYNLSRLIARGDEKSVLVIDLDMRKPRLHDLFQLDNRIGMSTLLSGHTSLEESIRPTPLENLSVITAGPATNNPTGLIMSQTFESILERLRGKYDYIFIDTPPTGLVSDPLKIMNLSDLVLYILRADIATKRFVDDLNRLQQKHDISLGIIFNGFRLKELYGDQYRIDYYGQYLHYNQERTEVPRKA